MISCDLARLVLVGAMAVVSGRATGDAALWIMVILLFIVTLLDSPFKSARSRYVARCAGRRDVRAGHGCLADRSSGGLVSGFALGGLVVAALGVPAALLTDAAVYVISDMADDDDSAEHKPGSW
jgi:hypothetical protein